MQSQGLIRLSLKYGKIRHPVVSRDEDCPVVKSDKFGHMHFLDMDRHMNLVVEIIELEAFQ